MSKTRVLNMEEKRKLEKIIFEDIDRANSQFRAKISGQVDEANKELLQSKDGLKLKAEWVALDTKQKEVGKSLEKMGLRVSSNSYGEDKGFKLETCYNFHTKEVEAIYKKQSVVEEKLKEMKRSYTLKLFAGGEEAEAVFNALTRELKAILG